MGGRGKREEEAEGKEGGKKGRKEGGKGRRAGQEGGRREGKKGRKVVSILCLEIFEKKGKKRLKFGQGQSLEAFFFGNLSQIVFYGLSA